MVRYLYVFVLVMFRQTGEGPRELITGLGESSKVNISCQMLGMERIKGPETRYRMASENFLSTMLR